MNTYEYEEEKIIPCDFSNDKKSLSSSGVTTDIQLIIERLYDNDPTFKSIEIINKTLTHRDVEALSQAIIKNTILRSINISSCRIDDEDASSLAEALIENKSLQSLHLEYNKISNKGAISLGKALQKNKTLQSLNLNGNQIGDKGAIELGKGLKRHQTLKTLDLWGNRIGDKGVAGLGAALMENESLHSLNLWANQIGDKGVVSLSNALKENKALRLLNLWCNRISDRGAISLGDALKTNQTLRFLELRGNQIGDKGGASFGEALKTNQSLQGLNLEENQLGLLSATALGEALKQNETLQFLNLANNRMGDKGAAAFGKALKENHSLQTLNFDSNNIGNNGVMDFVKALETNQTLQLLNFGNNHISSKGAISLSEACKTNQTLQSLNLNGNQIGDKGAIAFGQALKREKMVLQELWLRGNQIGDKGAVGLSDALKTNQGLCLLDLNANQITDKGASSFVNALETNQTLQSLELGNTRKLIGKKKQSDVTDNARFDTLQLIHTYDEKLFDEPYQLNFKNSIDTFQRAFGNNNNFLGDQFQLQIEMILQQHLRALMLPSECEKVNAQVSIAYCYENGINIPQNKKTAFEWYLKAANKNNQQAYMALKRLGSINSNAVKSKYEKMANLGDPLAMSILGCLYQYCQVADLHGNILLKQERIDKAKYWYERAKDQDDATTHLAKMYENRLIGKNLSVQDRYIKATMYYQQAADKGNRTAKACLKKNASKILTIWLKKLEKNTADFTELNLRYYQLTNKSVSPLVEALEGNTNLLKLDISHNKFQAPLFLEKYLSQHPSLVTMNLSHNPIGSALSKNQWRLYPDYSPLQPLADFLKKNTTLRSLNLSYMNLTDKDVKAIQSALDERKAPLFKCDISGNPNISAPVAKKLKQTIQQDRWLLALRGSSAPELSSEPLIQEIHLLNEIAGKLPISSPKASNKHEPLKKSPTQEINKNRAISSLATLAKNNIYLLPNTNSYVKEENVDSDGNCAFTALETDRQTVKNAFISVLDSSKNDAITREKKLIVLTQLSKELIHLCIEDHSGEDTNIEKQTKALDLQKEALKPLYRFYRYQTKKLVKKLKKVIHEAAVQKTGALGVVGKKIKALPKPKKICLAPYLQWIKEQQALLNKSKHSQAHQYLNQIEKRFHQIIENQKHCREVMQAWFNEKHDPKASNESLKKANPWDTFFNESDIRTYMDYAYAGDSTLYGGKYSLELYTALNGQHLSIYTLSHNNKSSEKSKQLKQVPQLQETSSIGGLTPQSWSTLNGLKSIKDGKPISILHTHVKYQDNKKRELNHYNKLKPITTKEVEKELQSFDNDDVSKNNIASQATHEKVPQQVLPDISAQEAYQQFHLIFKKIASAFAPSKSVLIQLKTKCKRKKAINNPEVLPELNEMECLQLKAVGLVNNLKKIPATLSAHEKKPLEKLNRLLNIYLNFLPEWIAIEHDETKHDKLPLRVAGQACSKIITKLANQGRKYEFPQNATEREKTINWVFSDTLSKTLSHMHTASQAIATGAIKHTKYLNLREKKYHAVKKLLLTGVESAPLVGKACKAIGVAGHAIHSFIEGAEVVEAAKAATEFVENIPGIGNIIHKVNSAADAIIKGSGQFSTKEQYTNFATAFSVGADKKFMHLLGKYLSDLYQEQLSLLPDNDPIQAENFANACAEHIMKGMFLGYFKRDQFNNEYSDPQGFLDRIVLYLRYVPMKNPPILYTIKGSISADELLKAPALTFRSTINQQLVTVPLEESRIQADDAWKKRGGYPFKYKKPAYANQLGTMKAIGPELEILSLKNNTYLWENLGQWTLKLPASHKLNPNQLSLHRNDALHDEITGYTFHKRIDTVEKKGDKRDKEIAVIKKENKQLKKENQELKNNVLELKEEVTDNKMEITTLQKEFKTHLKTCGKLKNERDIDPEKIGAHITNSHSGFFARPSHVKKQKAQDVPIHSKSAHDLMSLKIRLG